MSEGGDILPSYLRPDICLLTCGNGYWDCEEVQGGGRPVVIRNLQFRILEKILDFIYMGKVELEDIDIDDFKNGLDLLKFQFRIENIQISESESRQQHLEIQSIGTPDNEYETTLELDLKISFDSSESEMDDDSKINSENLFVGKVG